jgi:hypothetical protein
VIITLILNIAEISKGKQKCKQNSLIVIKIDKSIVKKTIEKQLLRRIIVRNGKNSYGV